MIGNPDGVFGTHSRGKLRPTTGKQYELSIEIGNTTSHAIITEVGANLRLLTVNGVSLVETFEVDQEPPLSCGAVLVPWPSRVTDGIWQLDGRRMQLDLNEPTKHNAIHGLLRQTAYHILNKKTSSITMATTLFPQHGYPFQLDTAVKYKLVEDGLLVTHRIRNVSTVAAPVAIGAHPYLRIGDVPTRDLVLRVAARRHLEVDCRLAPLSQNAVAGTIYDFRSGQCIGDLSLDEGYSDLIVVNGVSRHTLTAPDGRFVELWQDDAFRYLQVYTTKNFPDRESVIAIEPTTAAANALNNGLGIHWLGPCESWSVSWGIRYSG